MIVNHIKNDAKTLLMQNSDRIANFLQSTRSQSSVRCKKTDRVISPGIGKSELHQMPLIGPRHERHEFNRINAKPLEMRKARGMCKGCNSAAQLFWNIGVKFAEGFDGNLVDETGWLISRAGNNRFGWRNNTFCNEVTGFGSMGSKIRMPFKVSVKPRRIGIDQQL